MPHEREDFSDEESVVIDERQQPLISYSEVVQEMFILIISPEMHSVF